MCDDMIKTKQVILQENNIIRDKSGILLGRMQRSIDRQEIVNAVAQAWCTLENRNKPMDTTLAEQIVMNIMNLF